MIQDIIVDLIGFATFLSHVFIVLFLLSFLFKLNFFNDVKSYLRKNSLPFSFILSLLAVAGSLFFSEVMGFQACILCWFQRIIIFPLLVIFFIALIKKIHRINSYIFPLIFIGSLIAIYNIIVERTGSTFCDTVSSIPCNIIYISYLGYITIPVMSLTFFILIGILMFGNRYLNKLS